MLRLFTRFILVILVILKWALALIVIITIVQHFITPVFQLKEGTRFTGPKWYNPYHNSRADWLKMNLHAHSKAWGGLTAGVNQNNEDIYTEYTRLGYDIIGISNYHDPQQIYFRGNKDSLTVYEYGYNLFKAHRLVVGYSKATFREVSLFHNVHDRQFILNEAYPDSKLMVIAHPQFGKGHEMEDFKKLCNYHLIEVLNHYRYSEGEWDTALSYGKAVFIIGNDDMHYLDQKGEVGVRYTQVDARENLSQTLEELKAGNAYGVSAPNQSCHIKLSSFLTDSFGLHVTFDVPADKIEFIGQGGLVKDSALHVASAQYAFRAEDSYIRVKAYKDDCTLYLNPCFRTEDGTRPVNECSPDIDWLATLGEKTGLLLALTGLVYLLIRIKIKIS